MKTVASLLPASRPPLLRMARIHDLLSQQAKVTCERIAQEAEVSPRTARRDLDFMRDQLALPIEYDAHEHSFTYAGPVTGALFGAAATTAAERREVA